MAELNRKTGKKIIGTLLAAAILIVANGAAFAGVSGDSLPAYETALAARPDSRDSLPELGEGASLEDYILYAELGNPGLRALYQGWRAAAEGASYAGVLPDPVLGYSYYIREVETRVGPQQHRLSLAQKFPWFGKLRLKEEAARSRAESVRQKLLAARLALRRDVISVYADLYYLDRAIAINEENLELLGSLESVVRTRYSTGGAEYSSLIKLQVEAGRLEDRIVSLRELRRAVAGQFNSLLARESGAAVPVLDSLPLFEPGLPDDSLRALLAGRNPELLALQHEQQARKSSLELAGKSKYPDLTLGMTWIRTGEARMAVPGDDGKDPLMFGVSLNLPLHFGSYGAREREAAARVRRTGLERQDRENTLSALLDRALFDFHDAARRVELYRGSLIPKADQAFAAARRAFAGGSNDFLNLIDAQRTLLEFSLALEKARAEAAAGYAEILRLTGTETLVVERTKR